MAQAKFNDVVMEKFSGTEPEDDANAFVKQVEYKIKVTLGQLPAPGYDRENYLFRQRALFASLLRGPAAEGYAANINEEDAAHTWDFIKREFRTRFTDGRDKYRFRIQAENIKRTENEPIKTYLQRVKKSLIEVGQQSTWLGPLLLSEPLQTIKYKSIETKNIIHSDRKVSFSIL